MSPCPLKDAAIDAPNNIAIITSKKSITYRELHLLADTFSKDYKATQRVIFCECPSIELIAKFFAAWRKNACICPLNLRNPKALLESQIGRLQKKSPDALPITQSAMLFTSGSSGTPKIAVLPLSALLANAEDSIELIPTDRYLLSLPLYHVGGIGIVLRCVLARSAIVLKNHPAKRRRVWHAPQSHLTHHKP
jgi:O-succinylbenzoic acid--CoA ligase